MPYDFAVTIMTTLLVTTSSRILKFFQINSTRRGNQCKTSLNMKKIINIKENERGKGGKIIIVNVS